MFLNSIAVVTHPLPLIQVKRCGLENQCVTSLSISRHLRIKQTRSSRAYTSSMSSKATTTFLSPPPPEKLDASPAVCFLLLPGAFLTPSDYADLTEAIRQAADDSSPLALYLAIGVVDWTKMDPRNPSSALTAFNTAAEDALIKRLASPRRRYGGTLQRAELKMSFWECTPSVFWLLTGFPCAELLVLCC